MAQKKDQQKLDMMRQENEQYRKQLNSVKQKVKAQEAQEKRKEGQENVPQAAPEAPPVQQLPLKKAPTHTKMQSLQEKRQQAKLLKNRKDSGVAAEEMKKAVKPRHQRMASMESLPESESAAVAESKQWKCQATKAEAHSTQVCAVASCGNCLYSSANKNLKIWDLETMNCLSDIHAHNSFIKCMQVWQTHSYLLTAADRTFMIWDLISLTNVFTVKYHREEIRAVQVTSCGNYMVCAGKGSQS